MTLALLVCNPTWNKVFWHNNCEAVFLVHRWTTAVVFTTLVIKTDSESISFRIREIPQKGWLDSKINVESAKKNDGDEANKVKAK